MVFAIALPMTLAYMTTPLLGLVDTAVVGRLGDAAQLGGLAVGAVAFDIVFAFFPLRASTTGLVAQALGRGDGEEQRAVFLRSLIVAVVCGLVLLFGAPLVIAIANAAMDLPAGVATAMASYITIRMVAAPFTLLNYTVLGWLLGLGRAKTGLAVQAVLGAINIVLSLWLGLWLGWGLEGVAWATVAAEALTAMLGLYLYRRATGGETPISRVRIANRAALLRLFQVNRDVMIRSMILLFAFAFHTAQGATFGETTLAANAILMNFFMVSGFLLDGFATAAEQLVGRAIGAHYRPAFRAAVRYTLLWGAALALVLALIFVTLGSTLIDILTINEAVRAQANLYLLWAAATAVTGVLAFQMDGVYIGATWSATMRNMMILSLIVYLAVWWLAAPSMGNHGLWLALNVFLAIRGVTLSARLPHHARMAFGS